MPTTKDPATEPRSRDADRSQLAILVAARDEFAQHGLGGARVDRIAERADVNKRLIYYYFGSKDDLFLAVLESTYADIREAEKNLHLTDLTPVEGIRRLTEFTWTYYIDHPEFPETPLVMEAYLEGRLWVLAPRSDSEMDARKAEAAGVAKLHRAVDLWLRLRTGKADTAQGLVWRGRIQVFENEHAKGIFSLREALVLDPNHFVARWHLAMAVAQDSPTDAARHLETLLAREPENYPIRFGLARTYRMLGRTQDSQRILSELRAIRPNDPSVLLELANLALDAGRVDDATPLVTRVLELTPDSPPVLLTAMRYHQLANHPDEVERYRKRVESMQAEQQKQRESAAPSKP